MLFCADFCNATSRRKIIMLYASIALDHNSELHRDLLAEIYILKCCDSDTGSFKEQYFGFHSIDEVDSGTFCLFERYFMIDSFGTFRENENF
jgi:hypothetical protein